MCVSSNMSLSSTFSGTARNKRLTAWMASCFLSLFAVQLDELLWEVLHVERPEHVLAASSRPALTASCRPALLPAVGLLFLRVLDQNLAVESRVLEQGLLVVRCGVAACTMRHQCGGRHGQSVSVRALLVAL